jgi:hypothetical protein
VGTDHDTAEFAVAGRRAVEVGIEFAFLKGCSEDSQGDWLTFCTGNRSDPPSETREVTMLRTTRSVIGVGVLAIGCLLGIGASSAQAQALASAQALGSVSPAPVDSYPAPRYYIPAPLYSYPAQCYYIPAPVSPYPARTWAYQPRRSDSYPVPASSSSAQDYSQPNRSYSYYDQDGVEHDSRYPHWSFDTRRARPSGGG